MAVAVPYVPIVRYILRKTIWPVSFQFGCPMAPYKKWSSYPGADSTRHHPKGVVDLRKRSRVAGQRSLPGIRLQLPSLCWAPGGGRGKRPSQSVSRHCRPVAFRKNGNLSPQQVTPNSNRKVWWQCEEGHDYQATVAARTVRRSGCPYCSGKKVLAGFNDIATLVPKLTCQ